MSNTINVTLKKQKIIKVFFVNTSKPQSMVLKDVKISPTHVIAYDENTGQSTDISLTLDNGSF